MDVKLVMFKPDGQRKDFPIVNPITVIGRAESCDLRIPVLSVSRRHCEMVVSHEEVKVRDLASSNGTYINNQRVNESPIKAGDRVVIGPVVFTVQVDVQPKGIEPVKTRGQRLAEQGPQGSELDAELQAEIAAELDDSSLSETKIEKPFSNSLEDQA